MAEETNTPTKGSDDPTKGNPDGEDNNDDNQDLDYKAEFDRIKKQNEDIVASRNKEKKKRQEIESQLEAIKAEADKKVREQAEKKGDVEEIKRRAQEDINKLQTRLVEKERQLERYVKRAEILRLAAKHGAHDPDVVADLVHDKIKLVFGENDEAAFEVADDWVNHEQFISNYLDKKPYLKKNSRSAGVGDTGGAGSDSKGKVKTMPDDFATWDSNRQKAFFRDNPELGDEYMKGFLQKLA